MESVELTVNGAAEFVKEGDIFTVHREVSMGQGREDLTDGDVLTVENISGQPDGVHFEFSVEREPDATVEIYGYALEKELEAGSFERGK